MILDSPIQALPYYLTPEIEAVPDASSSDQEGEDVESKNMDTEEPAEGVLPYCVLLYILFCQAFIPNINGKFLFVRIRQGIFVTFWFEYWLFSCVSLLRHHFTFEFAKVTLYKGVSFIVKVKSNFSITYEFAEVTFTKKYAFIIRVKSNYSLFFILFCMFELINLVLLTKQLQVKANASSDEERPAVVELAEDVESAACQLWDMTAEPDVVLHLLDLGAIDILQLATDIITLSRAPRLTVSYVNDCYPLKDGDRESYRHFLDQKQPNRTLRVNGEDTIFSGSQVY